MLRKLLLAWIGLCSSVVHAEIVTFAETFNGGFDNEWTREFPDDQFTEEGLRFSLGVDLSGNLPVGESIGFETAFLGVGSFSSTARFQELSLGEGLCEFLCEPAPPGTSTAVSLRHVLAPLSEPVGGIGIRVVNTEWTDESDWFVSVTVQGRGVDSAVVSGDLDDIVLGIEFDNTSSSFTAIYEGRDGRIEFGPHTYGGPFESEHIFFTEARSMPTRNVEGVLDHFSIEPKSIVDGDFNGDDLLGIADINILSETIRAGNVDSRFDLNDDRKMDFGDLRYWLEELKQTHFGDANLDGEFASSDLVNVFAAGEYEDDIELNSTWATGDWNGDGDFTSSDLVLAFQDGGYELGPRVAVGVPEPAGLLGLAIGLAWLSCCRRCKVR